MTEKQHAEALKALKEINKLSIHQSHPDIDGDYVRIEYKKQDIELSNGMTLQMSGSLEQYNQKHCTTERIFLVISMLDQNKKDQPLSSKQLAKTRRVLETLIKA